MQRELEKNFLPVAKTILSDLKYGLVVMAEDQKGVAVGFMMFTYEWSDWRDGVFFWVQAVEASDEKAY